jgi:hypothetical protein
MIEARAVDQREELDLCLSRLQQLAAGLEASRKDSDRYWVLIARLRDEAERIHRLFDAMHSPGARSHRPAHA